MKKILFTLLMTLSIQSFAEVSVGVVRSFHDIEEEPGFNYTKTHLVISHYNPESTIYFAAIAPNSYGDFAFTGGVLKKFDTALPFGIVPEIYLGLVIGYKENIKMNYAGNVSPYGWLGFTIPTRSDKVNFKVRLVPNVYTVGLEYKF